MQKDQHEQAAEEQQPVHAPEQPMHVPEQHPQQMHSFKPIQPTPPQPQGQPQPHPGRGEVFSIPAEDVHQVHHAHSPIMSAPAPAPAAPVVDTSAAKKDRVYWSKLSPVVGFLVSYDNDENGEAFELRQGRIIVTCDKAAHGDYLVISDESVSPMHAILRVTGGGEVQVLDQLSEYGTKIKRLGSEDVEDLSGERSPVGHGDLLYFGKRSFHVCMVVKR